MEPMQGQPHTFREAVRRALTDSPEGIGLLSYPQRFHSLVADNCEENSVELDIFEANHDDAFVRFFREAAQRDFRTYGGDAIERGALFLYEDRHIDRTQAHLLCYGLAAGISDYLGIPFEASVLPPVSQSPYAGAAPGVYPPAGQMPMAEAPSMTPAVMPSMPPVSQQYFVEPQIPAQPSQEYAYNNAAGWSSEPISAPLTPTPPRKAPYVIGGALLGLALLVALVVGVSTFMTPKTNDSNSTGASTSTLPDPVVEQNDEPSEPVMFEVSFETGGGTRIESEEVVQGDKVFSPEDPTRDGYDFVGWFEDDTFVNAVSFPFVPEGDIVLFAKWEKTTVLDGALATANANGHTYALYDVDADWQAAKDLCEELGGHLATITSSDEQDTVENLIAQGSRNSYWLGGYLAARDDWRWITDENFSYTNWSEGTPDNWIIEGPDKDATEDERNDIDGSENALIIYRVSNPNAPQYANEWNDLARNGDCNGEDFFGLDNIGYVCEWDGIVE